ncbi:nickel-binding protein [Kribbella sp. NPDC050124]|uniref:nickel-binding protein n=1 Tax=Kribbella sp. NPDC050124 TaxID=3364114 RepID=UPI0037A99D5D
MNTYIVERHLPGVAAGDLTAAAVRARDAADQLTREGMPVRYLSSVYVPSDGSCHCLFEAASETAVRQVNELAAIPVHRIAVATQLAASALPTD